MSRDNYYLKYKKYKFQYKHLRGGSSQNPINYRQKYLEAIDNNDCPEILNLETFFSDIYGNLTSQQLLSRDLFLSSSDFDGTCGDFWKQLPDTNGQDWRKVISNNYQLKAQDPDVYKVVKQVFINKDEKKLISENKVLLFQSRKIPNLFAMFLDQPNQFCKILYYDADKKVSIENIVISYTDVNLQELPVDSKLFNINGDLSSSIIKECHIDFFFYNYPVTSQLRQEIVDLLKKSPQRFSHWSSWLLGSIINLIFNCLKCSMIHLKDASKFDRKKRLGEMDCKYWTIIYQTAKNKKGFYQNLGFKADPPLETDNLGRIMDMTLPQKSFVDSHNPIYIRQWDNQRNLYYLDITTGLPSWSHDDGEIITSQNELIPVESIKKYLTESSQPKKLIDLLKKNEITIKDTDKKVVVISVFLKWLLTNKIPIVIKKIEEILGHYIITYLIKNNVICGVCYSKIDPYSELLAGDIVLIKSPGNPLDGLVVKIVEKIDIKNEKRENETYSVLIKGDDNFYYVIRKDIHYPLCRSCEKRSIKLRKTVLNSYNLITFPEVTQYIYKVMWNWNQYLVYHKKKSRLIGKNKRAIEKLDSFYQTSLLFHDKHPQKVFSLTNFINWYGIYFYDPLNDNSRNPNPNPFLDFFQ